jgi:hypothetical protein
MYKYEISQQRDKNLKVFNLTTALICTGGVTPLHLAAAIGSPGLCQWLVSSGCFLNQNRGIGTPLHCALLTGTWLSEEGLYSMGDKLEEEYEGISWNEQNKTFQLLIINGADLNASYRHHFRQVYSYCRLALSISISSVGMHFEHPLIFLIRAGARLDEHFPIAFEYILDVDDWYYGSRGKEFLEVFIETLKQSDNIKDCLVKAAVQFKHSSKFNLEIVNEKVTTIKEKDEISSQFLRAVRFDQNPGDGRDGQR